MPTPKTIVDLTAGDPVHADVVMFRDDSLTGDRKSTLANLVAKMLGIGSSTVAGLPSASPAGMFLMVTDGRKSGEGAAAGTGVLCQSNGTNWKTVDTGGTVAA